MRYEDADVEARRFLGRSEEARWVKATFADLDPPLDRFAAWIEESYRLASATKPKPKKKSAKKKSSRKG